MRASHQPCVLGLQLAQMLGIGHSHAAKCLAVPRVVTDLGEAVPPAKVFIGNPESASHRKPTTYSIRKALLHVRTPQLMGRTLMDRTL